MQVSQDFIIKIFKQTKKTQNKTILNIKEKYCNLTLKYIYLITTTDNTKYIYTYEQQDTKIKGTTFYNRIIKVKEF